MAHSTALVALHQTARCAVDIMFWKLPNFMRNFYKVSFNELISKAMPSIVEIEAHFDCEGYTNSLQGSWWLWQKNFVISCYQNLLHENYELLKQQSQILYFEDTNGENIKFFQIDCVSPKGTLGSLLINHNGVCIGLIVKGGLPFGLTIPINMVLQSITRFIIYGNQFRMGQSAFFQNQYDTGAYDENYNGLNQNYLHMIMYLLLNEETQLYSNIIGKKMV